MCQARGCHKGVTGHTMELPVVVHTLYMRSSYYRTTLDPLPPPWVMMVLGPLWSSCHRGANVCFDYNPFSILSTQVQYVSLFGFKILSVQLTLFGRLIIKEKSCVIYISHISLMSVWCCLLPIRYKVRLTLDDTSDTSDNYITHITKQSTGLASLSPPAFLHPLLLLSTEQRRKLFLF